MNPLAATPGPSARTTGDPATESSESGTFTDPRSRLPWPMFPALMPLWYAWIAWSWWDETNETLREAQSGAASAASATIALTALGARLFALLGEAGFYALWWRARATPLSYWRFFAWIATLSVTDLIASGLRQAAPGAPPAVQPLLGALAGTGITPAGSGWGLAFGTVGLLALLRVGATGWVVARGTGRSPAGPVLLVAAAWLLTRLATWWSFDLVKGVSPLR